MIVEKVPAAPAPDSELSPNTTLFFLLALYSK